MIMPKTDYHEFITEKQGGGIVLWETQWLDWNNLNKANKMGKQFIIFNRKEINMIIGYEVTMIEYYDDFSSGGTMEIFSRIFPTLELAKEQFDICKKYIIKTETKKVIDSTYISVEYKEEFIKNHTFDKENTFGIADYDSSMIYWGTEAHINTLEASTEIDTELF